MNSCQRWKRPANSFAEECNESNEHLDVLKTLEKRNKAPGPDFRNTEHPCTSNYLGGAELKRHESWKTVAKDNENHTNVNICNNELFTASYTDKNHTKQAHNSRKKMEERNRAMDVVDETSSYFLNGHIPANNSDETRIYSDLMQSRVLGTSKEREQEQITVRPEYGSCGHFSTDPIQTTSSSSNTFQEAFGNCTEVMAPTKHKDSNLQAGRRTLCGISQHTSSTAATLLTGEDTPCRFCEHVPNLVNMPAQTVSSTLSAPRETFTQSSKVHTVRGNKAPSLQNDDAVMDRSCKQATSKRSASSEDELCCRICHSVTDLETLVSPCLCTGSMKYVHESCLLNWLKSSVKTNCELCLHEVPVKKLVKPFSEVSCKRFVSIMVARCCSCFCYLSLCFPLLQFFLLHFSSSFCWY